MGESEIARILLNQSPSVFLLGVIIWAGMKGYWMWHWSHKDICDMYERQIELERRRVEDYKQISDRAAGLVDRATTVVEGSLPRAINGRG